MKFVEGTIITSNISKNGPSCYLLLTPEILDYLGIIQEDTLAVKCERSKQYGPFIGVGKLQIEIKKTKEE